MADLVWDDRDLQQALAQLIATQPEAVAGCLEQACIAIEREAKKECPSNENGVLRASITHDVTSEGTVATGRVGTNTLYGIYVHQGTGIYAINGDGRKEVPWTYMDDKTGEFISTKGIHPNPFLKRATENKKHAILGYFKDVLKGHVRQRVGY